MEALREVGLSLTTELDLDALLHSIVSHAVELWGCRVGSLYLHRPDKDLLELVVIIGAGSDLIGVTLRRGEGLAGEIWKTGEPLSVSEQRSLAGQPAMPTEENPFSFAGVPIRWGDEFLGVLDLVSDDPGAFSSDDTELLSLFASQASIAIKNARLFQAERRRSSEAEALRKASLVLGALWGLWHLPLHFIEGTVQSAIPVYQFVLQQMVLAVFYTWLYNHTRGAVSVAIIGPILSDSGLNSIPLASGQFGGKARARSARSSLFCAVSTHRSEQRSMPGWIGLMTPCIVKN